MGNIAVRPRLSRAHPIWARGHIDGDGDEYDDQDGAYDDASHDDAGDGDDRAIAAAGAVGGSPCGATKRVRGVPTFLATDSPVPSQATRLGLPRN